MKTFNKILGLVLLHVFFFPVHILYGADGSIIQKIKSGDIKTLSPGDLFVIGTALMPQQSIQLFQGLVITSPVVTDGPQKIADSAGTYVYIDNFYINGSAQFKDASGIARTIAIEVVTGMEQKTNERYWTLTLKLPENWKLSDMFKTGNVKFPDDLKLPKAELTVSNFPEYLDARTGITYKKGLTFTSDVGLTGPTSDLNTFLYKLRTNPNGSYRSQGLKFVGRIGTSINDFAAVIMVPAGIKIDLSKGGTTKPFVKEIILGEMSAGVTASPFALTFQASAQLDFSNPKQGAIQVKSSFDINPTGFVLSGEVIGSLAVTDWLTLQDVGLAVGVGYTSPFLINELSLKGIFDFGGKTQVSVVGSVAMTPEPGAGGNVAFIGSVKNLDFADVVALMSRMTKKPVSTAALPDMKLEQFDIYLVPVDTTLFGVKYYEGFKLNVQNLSLFGQKASCMFEAKELTKSMRGKGSIQLDIAGIRLDSTIDMLLSAEKPEQNYFSFSSALNIPQFKFIGSISGAFGRVKGNPTTGKLEIVKSGELTTFDEGALFDGEIKIANIFDAIVDVQVDFTQPKYSRLDYNLTSSMGQQAKAELDKAVKNLQAQVKSDLAQFTADLKDFNNDLAQAKQDFGKDAQNEKARVEARIKKLISEIKALDKKCKAEPWYNMGLGKSCLDKTGKDFELAGLQAYYQTLLKPGTSVVSGTLGVAEDISKKIEETQVLQKIAQGMADAASTVLKAIGTGISAFEITQATGWFYLNDAGAGKLAAPYIKILTVRVGGKTVQFKDIELSVNNIEKMFAQIAEGIVAWVKNSLASAK